MGSDIFRSSTHPVTNLAELTVADARSQLGRLLTLTGGMPDSTWSTFAHELTHHWCFISPVGQALADLYLRPVLAYIELQDEQARDTVKDVEEEVVRFNAGIDLVTYDMTYDLLWPFIEGMALFTEFDLIPNPDGEIYSFPLHWTLLLYANPLTGDRGPEHPPASTQDLDAALLRFLLRARTSEQLIDRKAGVLAQPLTKARETYLASYLLVKNLWVTLALRDPRLWNAELFFGFLHRYFFCDMALVAKLLEPDDGRTDRYQNVADYFNQSLIRLANEDLSAVIDAVIDYISTPLGSSSLGDFYTQWSSLNQQRAAMEGTPVTSADHALWDMGIELLLAELSALSEKASVPGEHRALNQALMWMMTQRDSFCVIDEPVRIRVTEARRLVAMLDGTPLYSSPACQGFDLPPGEYDGTVSGYVMPLLSATFVALAIGGRIGSIGFSRELPEPFPSQLLDYRMDASEQLEALEGLRAVARDWVTGDPTIEIIASAVEENLAGWHQHVAAEQALPHVPEERRREVVSLLDKGGFAAVVATSRLRGLATITLLASLPISRSTAGELFNDLGDVHRCAESHDELLEFIRERGRDILNDELLFDADPGLFSAV